MMMKAQKDMIQGNAEKAMTNKMDLLSKAKVISKRNNIKSDDDIKELVKFADDGGTLSGENIDVAKLMNDLLASEIKNEELLKKMKSVDAERKKLSKDMKKRDSELVKARKEIDSLRVDLKAYKKDIIKLGNLLDDAQNEFSEETKKVARLKSEKNELIVTLKERDDFIKGLVSTIRDYERSDFGEMKAEMKDLNREIRHWQNEHRNMKVSRDQLNKKHVAKLKEFNDLKGKLTDDIRKLEVKNQKLTQSNFDVKESNRKLRDQLDKANSTVTKLRKSILSLDTWPDNDKRLMLRNIDRKLFMDALIYRIRHEKKFRIPKELRNIFESEIEFEEIQRAKRDMAIAKLSKDKFSGFERLTAVGVLLTFGDGTYGFKNINTDDEYGIVDVGRFGENVADGVVVRVEILSDEKVRVVDVYSTKVGNGYYESAKKRRKKINGSRTDGFGVSDELQVKLTELIGDRNVVLIGSGFSNTMREYLRKHVNGIELIDAYEDGDRKTQNRVLNADICILQPDKIPHTVVELIEDKKDEKYIWAKGVNPRELVRMIYLHLISKKELVEE